MAPQQRRPIAALRRRLRRRIQNFRGIISGTYPNDIADPLPSEYHRRGSASASSNTGRNRNSRYQPKRSSTWSSLSSITESDESEEEEETEPLVQTSSNQSAGPSNPFSDFYASERGNEDGGHTTGLELVRVNNNSERDMQVMRHRSPYSSTAASERTYQISIPRGMKWKSTPGAYAFTAPVKPVTKDNTPTTGGSASATTSPQTTANPKIQEIDWNHNLTGPYATQSLRPANPSAMSRRISSLAYSHPDSCTMMAMLENSTPACDLTVFGQGNFRVSEFDALGMMGYDLQWLEYMSIPSGGLGSLKRWFGRRLGFGSVEAKSGGAGSAKGLQRHATVGCATEIKSSMRPIAGAGKRVRFSTA